MESTQLLEPKKESYDRVLNVYELGFVKDYKKVWDLQKGIVASRVQKRTNDSLVVVEHDHVLTLGRSSHLDNVLVGDLPIFDIERGGDVTYHGPGQLVMYPIISLQERGLGVRQFVEIVESSIESTLSSLGIQNAKGKLGQETGVWVDGKRKIASIGVAVSHWVTYHGLALNVNTNLTYFKKIKPCGFEASVMTSVSKELGKEEVDMDRVKGLLISAFAEKMDLILSNMPSPEL